MPTPTDGDVLTVQEELEALYATLSPTQRDVLDAVIAAALTAVHDDTGGFIASLSRPGTDVYARDRMARDEQGWRRLDYTTVEQSGERREPRWNLRPLLDWLYRSQSDLTGAAARP